MLRFGKADLFYSSDGGHIDATFVKGMILLSEEEEEHVEEGFKLLNNLHEKHGDTWKIAYTLMRCRRMLNENHRFNTTSFKKLEVFCPNEAHNSRPVKKLLRKLRRDKNSVCLNCLWCSAYTHFCDGMRFFLWD